MADIEQLKRALINADKAGDTEAATALAAQIRKQQAQPAEPQPAEPRPAEKDPVSSLPEMSREEFSQGVQNIEEEKLAATGRGFLDFGQGMKQLFLGAGEKMGVVPEGRTQEYTQEVEQERAEYEQTPLAQSTRGKVGRFVGSALPYAAIPGSSAATLPGRMAAGAGVGAAAGGTQFVPEGESRAKNIAIGAGAGAAVPAAMRAAEAPIAKFQNAMARRMPQQAEDVIAAGESAGVPVYAPDVMQSPGVQKAATYLEDVPVVGMRGDRMGQMKAAQSSAEAIGGTLDDAMRATEFGGLKAIQKAAAGSGKRAGAAQRLLAEMDSAGDDWHKIIQTSGNASALRKRMIADKKYGRVEQLAEGRGPVDKAATVSAIDDAINQAQSKVIPDQSLVNELGKIKQNITAEDLTFGQMRQLRSDLNDIISSYYRGSNSVVGQKGAELLQGVQGAVERDLERFATSKGSDLSRAWKQADQFYKTNVIPYKDQRLAKALKQADADEVYGKFIARGKGDRAGRFYKALDDKGRAAVRYGMVSNALEKSVNPERGLFSPGKFASEIEKQSKAGGVFFGGKAKKELDGFTNLMRHIERAGQVFENPPTGKQLVPLVLFGGAAAVEPTTAAGAAGGAWALNKLFTSTAGRNLLLASSKAKPGTPQMEKLLRKLEETLSAGAATEAVRATEGAGLQDLQMQ